LILPTDLRAITIQLQIQLALLFIEMDNRSFPD